MGSSVDDKVVQMVNDYDKDVFNGDIGRVAGIDEVEQEVVVRFDELPVKYDFNELDEFYLSYATTIHKSQRSECPVVVMPIHTQHYIMLQRNLLYTALPAAASWSCWWERRRPWPSPCEKWTPAGG